MQTPRRCVSSLEAIWDQGLEVALACAPLGGRRPWSAMLAWRGGRVECAIPRVSHCPTQASLRVVGFGGMPLGPSLLAPVEVGSALPCAEDAPASTGLRVA